MKMHWMIHQCNAFVEENVGDSYIRVYVCNLAPECGLDWLVPPHLCLNTVYRDTVAHLT